MMRKLTFLIVFLFSLSQVFGQDRTITGKVVDETGATLPGATVSLKGTQKGTVTDINGVYSISVPATGGTLEISYVGYQPKQVEIGESNVIDVNMAQDVQSLEQVVVVGYGVQKKSLVTGSISKVKSEDIVSQPSLRVEQALQGRTSGVVFNQTSGNPGAQISVRVRGVGSGDNTDPLFIIDGLKTSKYVMNEIDPSDIESVEVLKDAASAAIYGSEGANGVIIITTKSGAGKKDHTEVVYSAFYGVQKANPVEVMNADQYRDYFAEASANNKRLEAVKALDLQAFNINKLFSLYTSEQDSVNIRYSDADDKYNSLKNRLDNALASGSITQAQYDNALDGTSGLNKKKALSFEEYKKLAFRNDKNGKFKPFYGNIDTVGKGTDWMKEIFQEAPMQNHHISITTSTEKTNLYLAGSYFTQDGVVAGEKNNFSRYNFMVNADHQAKDWLKVGTHVTLAQSKARNLPTNSIFNNVVLSAMSFDPTAPIYFPDSIIKDLEHPDSMLRSSDGRYYSISKATDGERVNPLALIRANENNTTTTERAIGDVYAEIQPIKGLIYKIAFSGEYALVTEDNWVPVYYYNGEFNNNKHSYISKEMKHYYRRQYDNTLSYTKNIEDHGLNLLLGQSAEKIDNYSARAQRSDMFAETDNFNIIDATPIIADGPYKNIDLQQTGGFREKNTKLSYFGRLNYNYKEKYLFTGIFRRDGSSWFAPNYKFGNFPSFSVGWNVYKEDFFNIPDVSLFKIRASWGRNGSTSNVTQNMWRITSTASNAGKAVIKSINANPNLRWETSDQKNYGFDLGMFKNRLTLTAEYFVKKTIDLLADQIPISWTSTDKNPKFNVGTIENEGLEFDLGYSNHDKEFKYDLKLTASYLKNEVTDFTAAKLQGYVLFSGEQHTRFAKGYPAWYFQGYKVLGIFQNWEEIRTYTDPKTGNVIQPNAQPGDPKILDVGGAYDSKGNSIPDGVIDTKDYTYLGKPQPTWTFGFNLNGEYKGFDAGVFLYSELDKTIFNAIARDDRTYYNRPARFYTDRWTSTNKTNDFIRATYENNPDYMFSHNSLFFEDGSFLRVKNVQIGYTFPQGLTKKVQITKLRIYVSGTNLWTLTNYTGSDPEIGQTGGSNQYGVDNGLYPSSKQYIAGINVTF